MVLFFHRPCDPGHCFNTERYPDSVVDITLEPQRTELEFGRIVSSACQPGGEAQHPEHIGKVPALTMPVADIRALVEKSDCVHCPSLKTSDDGELDERKA